MGARYILRKDTEVISKLEVLEDQLKQIETRKFVNYNDFAHGYLAALRWMLSE